MDRQTVYTGAIPLETDILNTNKNMMIALSKISAAVLGTSTIANGFAVTPTAPASLQINVAAGEIYAMANIDATAYSSLAADTTHNILKQGIALDAQLLTLNAPGTNGYSVNYLVQATYQDQDANAVALPYYNSANPSQPWSGPNNTGQAQYTSRRGVAVISAKAGIAATTGSQTTPAPDAGYVGLYVVTVAYGQTQITAGNISQYSAAPMMQGGLLQSIQNGNVSFGIDTGTANTYVVNFTPALTSRVEGQVIRFKAKTANNGASTLNDGIGAAPLVGIAHAALQGGEIAANGDCWAQWNSSVGGSGSYILLFCTGSSVQVGNATQSQHAVPLGQAQSTFAALAGLSSQAFSVGTATNSAHAVPLSQADGRYAKLSGALMTGAFGVVAGTVSAPGIYVSGDTSTGVYQPASGSIAFSATGVEKLRINSNGVQVGTSSAPSYTRLASAASGSGNNAIAGYTSGGTQIMAVTESAGGTTASSNAAAACVYVEKNSSTNRSINAGGTVNTSGADYAEYEKKSASCGVISKGDVVGFNANGMLVDKFSEAIRFGVKSTSPSYVGGDTWGTEEQIGKKPTQPGDDAPSDLVQEYENSMTEWMQKYESVRSTVDRIAYAGKVPVNVTGASVGDWVVPSTGQGGSIVGIPVPNQSITFDQYRIAVGRVNKILEDGRAEIVIRVA